ncbi:MAG: Asp23/Gls24 family envelope stress response protein [Clostridiales bacterium]|nr:Asp23/Gls24 family envelope stress response protein [Clostridiales bacterium]
MEDNINLSISEEVIATIAEKVVLNVAGVFSLSGGLNVLGKKIGTQGIKVDISKKDISLDVYIVVNYGVKIPDIAWEIQDKVKKELENMTGMVVTTVNVHIQGINYETKKDEVSKVD